MIKMALGTKISTMKRGFRGLLQTLLALSGNPVSEKIWFQKSPGTGLVQNFWSLSQSQEIRQYLSSLLCVMWCRHSIGQRLDSCAMRRTQKQWKDHHGAGNDNDYDYVMTICSFRKSGSCSFLCNPKSVIICQESREIRLLSFENLYLSGICQLVATTVTIKHANFAKGCWNPCVGAWSYMKKCLHLI